MRKIIFVMVFIFAVASPVRAQSFFVKTIETEMLDMLNEIRAENSLPPLRQHWEATRVAKYKAEEMRNLNYSAHNSPVHGNPAQMLCRYGIPFKVVGENISAGAPGVREAVDEWMTSPVYRGNILNPVFKEAGIGYSTSENSDDSYWVVFLML